MPKNSLNVSLKGADDIFSTEESRQEQQREQVQQIPIGELFPFKNHPFKVLDDEAHEIHCHHRKPIAKGGTDEYGNLVLISAPVHKLIHASDMATIKFYLNLLNLDSTQILKLNKFREIHLWRDHHRHRACPGRLYLIRTIKLIVLN